MYIKLPFFPDYRSYHLHNFFAHTNVIKLLYLLDDAFHYILSFRVPSEYKAMQMTESVRDEWFQVIAGID